MVQSSNGLNFMSIISFNMLLDHVHVYYMVCRYQLSFLTNLRSPFFVVEILKWLNSYLGQILKLPHMLFLELKT